MNNDVTLLDNFVPGKSKVSLPSYMAIDSSGYVWVTNSVDGSLTEGAGSAAPIKTPLTGTPHPPDPGVMREEVRRIGINSNAQGRHGNGSEPGNASAVGHNSLFVMNLCLFHG
jgi:hypothetical protein